ncbi:MAG: glycosyltransferase family 2 protein [Streptosporangiaceae bacterium]|nr:glycosyltransferase family 2 protein [Streptosporangiaceae bacterium]
MPVRNEEPYLAGAVQHILSQDYPGALEVVLAVGPSKDRTEPIAREIAASDPRVTVVASPTGRIPAGLNLAAGVARHDVLARMDGHAMMPPGYLRTGVAALGETGAADVGGVMAAVGITPFQQAVAWAMTSKAGVGSAAWHTAGGAGPADSVYLGIYRREAIAQVGGWDEGMLRAEDWELNYRIRANGGLIWFTPDLQVTYRPRTSIRALASQYWHYGRWRHVVMREHPETASFRYLAPPVASALVGASLLSALVELAVPPIRQPWTLLLIGGFVIPAIYLAGITAVSAVLSRGVPASVRVRLPLVLAIMHMSWGAGFILSPRGLHHALRGGTAVRSARMGLWILTYGGSSRNAAARATHCTEST